MTAPVPRPAAPDTERVEKVAEALHMAGTRPGFAQMPAWDRWMTLAVAALAAAGTDSAPAPSVDRAELARHVRGRGVSSDLCSYCVKTWPCPTVEEATYGRAAAGTDGAAQAAVERVRRELDDLATSRDPADRLIVRLLRAALDGPQPQRDGDRG